MIAVKASSLVTSSKSSITAIAVRDTNIRAINEITSERRILGETGEIYIVNEDRIMLTESRFIENSSGNLLVDTEGVNLALETKEDQLLEHLNYQGEKTFAVIEIFGRSLNIKDEDTKELINNLNWLVVGEINSDQALESVKNIELSYFIIGIIILIFTMFIGYLFSKNITKPIKRLNEMVNELEKNNYKYRIKISTKDELKRLSNSLNRTAEILEYREKEHTQLERSKTEFISITSHELRSPMTPMRAQLQMLIGGYYGKLNKKQEESLDIVARNTERLDNIIVDFLEISRIEAARLKFRFVKTDITPYIERVVKETSLFMPEKKIKIETKIEKLPIIESDPDRIMQVLRNLLNNAVKFSKKNTSINVSVKKQSNEILFSVQDKGRGINKEQQSRIFEPFFQAKQTMYRESLGTGLGLAIAKGIVKSQKGKIWFNSKENIGTTFNFTFPLKAVKEIEPIKLLFSKKTDKKEEIRDIFKSFLGPIGKREFNELDTQNKLGLKELINYINLIKKEKVIDQEQAEEFVDNLYLISGETHKKIEKRVIRKGIEKK